MPYVNGTRDATDFIADPAEWSCLDTTAAASAASAATATCTSKTPSPAEPANQRKRKHLKSNKNRRKMQWDYDKECFVPSTWGTQAPDGSRSPTETGDGSSAAASQSPAVYKKTRACY